MSNKSDIGLGVILGPLAIFPALFIVGLYGHYNSESQADSLIQVLHGNFILSGLSLFFVYPIMLIYGLPAALLLRKTGRFKPAYVLVVSIIPSTAIVLSEGGFKIEVWLYFSFLSVAVGMFAWWIAVRNANHEV